ncbi:MAG: RsmE family RNA methyltransferase [Bacteroidota bacterium]|nr:RsmE family RNA methyltransferase [Bacteroidota bacterium]
MQFPFFYIEQYDPSQKEITLDEETSRHIIQVLRMKEGGKLHLTDGKGQLLTATVRDDHKKHCTVSVEEAHHQPPPGRKTTIGISLVKNSGRFEWFLEKATEIGITEIIPLICERTEKQKFRSDRMKGICISAMLQSQQCWLPVLHEPVAYELLFRQEEVMNISQRFIAHCMEGSKRSISQFHNPSASNSLILVGPEGDFTPKELEMATSHHFIPVSLGQTRLRTETAGVAAAVLLALH